MFSLGKTCVYFSLPMVEKEKERPALVANLARCILAYNVNMLSVVMKAVYLI